MPQAGGKIRSYSLMIDQSKAFPKVGMSELKFSVIADTWSHSKARYRLSELMVSDQYRMRLPQNLGQTTMKRIIWTFWVLRWH